MSSGPTSAPITLLLRQWKDDDPRARDQAVRELYPQFRQMAVSRLGPERGRTLRPTMLVNEALIRLMESDLEYADRVHLLSVLSLKMRSVLADHARAMASAKRGGGSVHMTLSQADLEPPPGRDEALEILALNQALETLAAQDRRAALVVELSYLAGLERDEVAAALGVSVATVDRDLRFARAWLNRQLSAATPAGAQ